MPKFIFILLLSIAVYGDDKIRLAMGNILSLEELAEMTIVASTGTKKTVAEAPSIATIITHEQIERSSATTLSELLESVPGLHISFNGIHGYNYDFRGIHSIYTAQVITMINGTVIDCNQKGTRQIGFEFPTSLIERVEVIRGPGSAVYGADAFAGVVNVITKNVNSEQKDVGLRYGSFDTFETFLHQNIKQNDLKLAINLSYMGNDDDDKRILKNDLQTFFDSQFKTNASHAPAPLNTNRKQLTTTINAEYKQIELNMWGQTTNKMGTVAGVADALDPNGYVDTEQLFIDLYYKSKIKQTIEWTQKVSLGYNSDETFLYVFPNDTILPIGDDGNAFTEGGGIVHFPDGFIGAPSAKDRTIGYDSTLLFSNIENHLIRINIGATYTKTEFGELKNFGPGIIDGTKSPIDGKVTNVSDSPYIFIPNTNRKIYHISLQDEYNINDKLTLTAGVRDDYYSDFGNTLNPRLALVWSAKEDLRVKLLYGRAFHAPTFEDLYNQNNPVSIGNPNLKPETLDSIELGFDYTPNSKWNVKLNIYQYVADDLIDGVANDIGRESENVGKLEGRGVEIETLFQPNPNLFISADYAYRWTKDDKTNEKMPKAPVHLGHFRADWSFYPQASATWESLFVGDIQRDVDDPREQIDDYILSHLSLQYEYKNRLQFKFAIRNLFDKFYEQPTTSAVISDYPGIGRSLYAELSYKF